MSLSEYRALVRVTVEKRFALFRRYLFNSVTGTISLFLLFAVAFFGGQQVVPTALDGSESGLIVGFFVWTMAVGAYTDISSQIETEAEWGTLEQLFMSPFGLSRVVFLNSIVYVAGGVVSGLVVLGMMLLTTGSTLSVPPGVLILAPLTVVPVIGVGLVLGGLTLIYKKVQAISGIIQLGFVVFIALPLDAHPLVSIVPLTLGTRILETTMQEGTITAVQTGLVVLLAAKAIVFLGGGFIGLHLLQREARQRGVMGQY